MIQDASILQEIRDEWGLVEETWNTVRTNIMWAFGGGGYTSKKFRDLAYSLTLFFAFSVLEHTLGQLRYEGHFSCSKSTLEKLMRASQSNLPWVNYSLVDEARKERNKIAHERVWIKLEESRQYVDAIKAELAAWKILV